MTSSPGTALTAPAIGGIVAGASIVILLIVLIGAVLIWKLRKINVVSSGSNLPIITMEEMQGKVNLETTPSGRLGM